MVIAGKLAALYRDEWADSSCVPNRVRTYLFIEKAVGSDRSFRGAIGNELTRDGTAPQAARNALRQPRVLFTTAARNSNLPNRFVISFGRFPVWDGYQWMSSD